MLFLHIDLLNLHPRHFLRLLMHLFLEMVPQPWIEKLKTIFCHTYDMVLQSIYTVVCFPNFHNISKYRPHAFPPGQARGALAFGSVWIPALPAGRQVSRE